MHRKNQISTVRRFLNNMIFVVPQSNALMYDALRHLKVHQIRLSSDLQTL